MDDLFDVFDQDNTETTAIDEFQADASFIKSVKVVPRKRVPEASDLHAVEDAQSTKRTKISGSGEKAELEDTAIILADEFDQDVAKDYAVSAGGEGAAANGPIEAGAQVQQEAKEQESTESKEETSKAVQKITVHHSVRHQVAIPPGYNYIPLSQHVPPEKPARTYPFTLDPFQKVSVSCIQRNESVLVSAHTSAGKTVVAEYAIAQSLENKQRVIYTSPIKALSNQKYRELLQEFGDVGLMTGDVTINPNASCLVMTTEILRSMLYRGSEVIREVAWVIFDEVHYMREKERGVVWEETLILLPDSVRHVFLSATIPNALQFAEWIVKLHKQPCHVVYTDFRPTPLQHYLFPAGGAGIHLVVDEKSAFREENFQKAMASVQEKDTAQSQGRWKKKPAVQEKKQHSDLYKIVKMIMARNYQPVIVFSFVKRECEANALQLSKIDFNDETEKEMVKTVFENAIQCLSEDDRELPQIHHIFPLLQRGIGIHHAGLLPIIKEVIELLFQEGLLKVLFATETFSIGLNMPAKTVVFTSARKYDGREQRWVSSGEYIQMSGRAGRRGLDDRGIVILMIDQKMEPDAAKSILKGQPDRLNSAFHLSYNMILNLLRVEGVDPDIMLGKSFYQFQSAARLPELEKELAQLEDKRDQISVPREDEIKEYHEIRTQAENLQKDARAVMFHPTFCLPFLVPGRLTQIKVEQPNGSLLDFGWGVITNYRKIVPKGKTAEVIAKEVNYIVEVLLHCEKGCDPKSPKPCVPGTKGEMIVVPVALTTLWSLSTLRVNLPKDLQSAEIRNAQVRILEEIKRRFSDGVPLLDPFEDFDIKDEAFKKLMKRLETLENKLKSMDIAKSAELAEIYDQYMVKVHVENKIRNVRKDIVATKEVIQMDELKARKRVLRRLGYITEADVVEVKGRVACEISAGDELVCTEMMFNNVFNDMTPEQVCALLSCLTFDEKALNSPQLREELKEPRRLLMEIAHRIAKVSKESKLQLDEEAYINSFKPEMMEIVYAWAQGAKFSQICKMTDIFEGSIIRMMRRLEELLRQMGSAAKSIGNTELEAKFALAIQKIKRDIVFANSLYL